MFDELFNMLKKEDALSMVPPEHSPVGESASNEFVGAVFKISRSCSGLGSLRLRHKVRKWTAEVPIQVKFSSNARHSIKPVKNIFLLRTPRAF